MYCDKCGSEVPSGYRYCIKCGASMNNASSNEKTVSSSSQNSGVANCKYCGAAIVGNETSCPYCGGVFDMKESVKSSQQSTNNASPVQPILPPPSNHMVWSILSTVFCCLPFGVAAIIYSSKVDSAYNRGDYYGALEASKKAERFAWWSAISSVIVWVIYVVFVFAIADSDYDVNEDYDDSYYEYYDDEYYGDEYYDDDDDYYYY